MQYGCQATILQVTLPENHKLLQIHTIIVLLKFKLDLQSQTKVMLRKVWHLRNQKRKIQYGLQAAILKTILLNINMLPPIYTSIELLEFAADLQSQTKVQFLRMKIPLDRQAFILKMQCWKSIGFCP